MSTLAQGHADFLSIVQKILTETSRVKRDKKYRDAQSHVFSRFPPLSTRQQRYQGHESFRGVQKKTYPDQEKRVFSSQLPTTSPNPDARTTFNKDREKHRQREILESRDIRQVPNKRRVEVQCQNRDSLIRDGCTVSCTEGVESSLRDTGQLLLGRCGHAASHRLLAR